MIGKGFFISQEGFIIPVERHIYTVSEYPEAFGFTNKEIKKIYKKYGEKARQEGKAREDILKTVVKRGWIRGRKYDEKGNEYLSLNVNVLTGKTLSKIESLANMIINKKIYKHSSIYDEVRIWSLQDKKVTSYTLKDIIDLKMFNETYELKVSTIDEYIKKDKH